MNHTKESFAAFAEDSLARARARRDEVASLPADAGAEAVARAFDAIGRELGEAYGLSELFAAVHPDEGVRDVCERTSQEISAFLTGVGLDRELYEAFARPEHADGLEGGLARFVEHTLRDFRRSGVDQDEATRERIRALQDEIVRVGQRFDRNIVQGGRELQVADGHAALAGLPADYLASHPEDDDGTVTLTTDPNDVMPVLLYAERDDLRRDVFMMFNQRATPENAPVLVELVERRHELAKLLGEDSWASWVLGDKMIGDAATAHSFIDSIHDRARPVAEAELEELLAEKRTLDPAADEVTAWEVKYLIERVKRRRFEFDSQSVRPYFPYESVERGVIEVSERLYGVEIRRNRDEPVWHPSVKCFDVVEGGATVARFFLDMFPRDGKYKHAAMFDVRGGVEGGEVPAACLVCNFPEPKEGDDALLLHEQVTTVFHEFGHLLHHLFAVQPWYGFSGIACEWDFVEVPSQLFEEWAWDVDVLQGFAKHHGTGEPIPSALVERLKAAEEYGKGVGVLGQMLYAKFALTLFDSDPEGLDPSALMARLREERTLVRHVPGTEMQNSFGHLNGYSASYYTYMWSLVIAKDLFGRFGADLMDAEAARRYREAVLRPGGARDAAALVRDFLGRDFSYEAWEAWLKAS